MTVVAGMEVMQFIFLVHSISACPYLYLRRKLVQYSQNSAITIHLTIHGNIPNPSCNIVVENRRIITIFTCKKKPTNHARIYKKNRKSKIINYEHCQNVQTACGKKNPITLDTYMKNPYIHFKIKIILFNS